MRVAYFTNQYPATSHTFIRREIAAMEERGHSVSRYAVRAAPEKLEDPADREEMGKTRHVLGAGTLSLLGSALRGFVANPVGSIVAARSAARFASMSRQGIVRHLAYYVEALVVADWCRTEQIEHLHIHFGTNPATVGALVSELTGIPFSFTVHGPEEFDRAEQHCLGRKVARADFVAAVSSFGRSQLMRWVDLDDWGKIHVVHCGLDAAYLGEGSAPAAEKASFVCVARLSEQKGHLALLQSAGMLRDRGVPFSLTLIGDGPLRGAIEQAIERLQLGSVVRLTGWLGQSEIRREIRKATATVLPSFAEGLPVVLMESMALGRPAISTYIAGIPELVNEDCGWLVPAGDCKALCDAMHEVATSSPDTLRSKGEVARRQVADRHDIRFSAELLERHFLRAHQKRAARLKSLGKVGQGVGPAVTDEVA